MYATKGDIIFLKTGRFKFPFLEKKKEKKNRKKEKRKKKKREERKKE